MNIENKNISKVGIIGYPLSHSLSPLIHNYWLNLFNINGSYIPIEVEKDKIDIILRKIKDDNFKGFNITIPLKEKIIPYLDELDTNAKQIGAVNAVVVTKSGKLIGRNTDGYGFLENIKTNFPNFKISSGPILILGAGGSARSICFALKSLECKDIRILSRRKPQAQKLSEELGIIASAYDFSDQKKAMLDINMFVNTTPMGMENFPWSGIDFNYIPKKSLIYDIVYKPRVTALLKMAHGNGNICLGGIGMLLNQAIPCFEWWFGKKPRIDDKLEKIISDRL
ncbi:MAG: shikimate dehydrogenase [Rhodospirillaceae bacterium]|nr:shikimate dehydrogenase [Rhodospirillaceae bacterium]|tara:strand:- start:1306 stop:2151 length:846 start_codon:yes stop_codon:yes gene_type:complete